MRTEKIGRLKNHRLFTFYLGSIADRVCDMHGD